MSLNIFNIKLQSISTRTIIFVFILMISTYTNAQTFVLWNDGGIGVGSSSLTSIPGTFPGGTVTASNTGPGTNIQIGQEFNLFNLNGAVASEIFGTYGTLSSASKSLTFTFSTPVIINSFSIHDIDKGGAWHDAFSFTGITFSSVTTGGGVTANTTGTTFVPNSIGNATEFANWFTSTTTVTSFTINYLVTGGVTHAYLGYSMEVTPSQQTIEITGDTLLCLGDSIPLTAINDSIFSWATTSAPASILSLDSFLYVSPTVTTTYAVYGTSDTAFHTVYVDTLIQPINLGNDTSVCEGETVLLNINAPYITSYLWQDASTAPTFLVSASGTYWLQVSNQCNSESDSIDVAVNPIPNINITTPDTLLNCTSSLPINVDIGVAAFPGYTYSWTNGTSLNSSIIQNPISTPIDSITNYLVTVTDSSGLCTDTDSIEVKSCCITPTTSFTNSTCFGIDNGKIFASATDPFNNLTIEFHNNDAGFTLLQTSTGFNHTDTILNLAPGSYIVMITTSTGCSFNDTLTITEPPPVTLTNVTTDTIICINGTATIYGTGAGLNTPVNLIWDNGLIGDGPHNVNPTPDSTTYNVYALDANSCSSDTQSVIVALFPPIIIQSLVPLRPTICEGDSTIIKAIATGGGTDLIYTWLDGSGGVIGVSDTNQFIVTPSYDGEIFSVIVSDSCTTPTQTDIIITDWADLVLPTYTVSDSIGCYDQIHPVITNTTLNTGNIANVLWDFGDGNISNGPFSFQTSHDYDSPGLYNITLIITDQTGCVWDTIMDGIQIDAHSYPTADFLWNPNPTDYLNAQITFDNQSIENVYNEWLFITDAQYTSNDVDPVFQFPQHQPGDYLVRLKVTNKLGCQDSTTKIVIINDVFVLYIPTAFTPNGDGLNDKFKVIGEGIDFSFYKMSLFNRWGELIFETSNPNIGWNGTQNGALVPEGVYVWKIVAKEAHSPIVHKKDGFVTVLK